VGLAAKERRGFIKVLQSVRYGFSIVSNGEAALSTALNGLW
jgi:hypothetical protein